jgi:hypothetical protein
MWIAFYSMCASSDNHLVSSLAESGVILVAMLWASKAIIVVTEVKSVLSIIQMKLSLIIARKFIIFGAMFLEVVVTVLTVVCLSTFPGIYSFYVFGIFASQIVWSGIWVGRLVQVWRHISQASMVDYKHLREMHEEPTEIQMMDDHRNDDRQASV